MLVDRLREKDDETVLYHYCSPETFLEIIKNKTVRFSDINLLNDEEEGRYGYSIFLRAANELLEKASDIPELSGFGPEFLELIDSAWATTSLFMPSVIACFSTDGDNLGQWRGYANDAKGLAIGFRASRIRAMPVQLLDVLYEPALQIEEMKVSIGALFMKAQVEKLGEEQILSEARLIAASSVAFKNPAWKEEKEVRAQHVLAVEYSDEKMTLEDHGGETDRGEVDGEEVQFQSRNGTITAFIDLKFEVSAQCQPISNVVLGPKCPNAPENVMLALGTLGYENVAISSAAAAYR